MTPAQRERLRSKRFASFHTPRDSYRRPIVSDSLAVGQHQIAEHKRLFPGIRMTSEGQPVFENYRQHENYLKATGFVKLPSRKKRRSA